MKPDATPTGTEVLQDSLVCRCGVGTGSRWSSGKRGPLHWDSVKVDHEGQYQLSAAVGPGISRLGSLCWHYDDKRGFVSMLRGGAGKWHSPTLESGLCACHSLGRSWRRAYNLASVRPRQPLGAFALSPCGLFACLVSKSSEVLLGSLPARHSFQNSRL